MLYKILPKILYWNIRIRESVVTILGKIQNLIHWKTCPAKTFSKWACEVGFRKLAKSCILHNSLLSNLLRQSIWYFLINWWSWIARLIEFTDLINICPIHDFGKWISWIHFLNCSLFARPYSSWSCFHGMVSLHRLFWKVVQQNWYFVQKKNKRRHFWYLFGFDS